MNFFKKIILNFLILKEKLIPIDDLYKSYELSIHITHILK